MCFASRKQSKSRHVSRSASQARAAQRVGH
jgi:hypothetical protein